MSARTSKPGGKIERERKREGGRGRSARTPKPEGEGEGEEGQEGVHGHLNLGVEGEVKID